MAKRRVKKKEYEKLDDANIDRVSNLLMGKPPITKKKACELLNISYNTTRLNKIIEEYEETKAYRKKLYDSNKRKPVTDYEVKQIVLDYLKGESMSSIAKNLYRSTNVIKNVLKKYSIPQHKAGRLHYQNPELIPEEALCEDYETGELVWSARYNCIAEIMFNNGIDKYGPIYNIWVYGKFNERAYQPWYELGSLPILKELGIKAKDITITNRLDLEYK